MPVCGDKDSEGTAPTRKYTKFKKPVEAKKSIKKQIYSRIKAFFR